MSLPESEVFVSEVVMQDGCMAIRLVGDYHPDAIEDVYKLEAILTSNSDDALRLNAECARLGLAVEIYTKGDTITFSSESGESVECSFLSYSCVKVEPSSEELKKVVERMNQWYIAEHEVVKLLSKKLNSARSILNENARRVETKMNAGQKSDSSIVLYQQQLRLIERLLQELDS